jgi:chorismate mutase
MTRLRGIRGATTADSNSEEAVVEATSELLLSVVDGNGIDLEDVAAVIFTTTEDVDGEYPATVARKVLGWEYVPLLDVQQMKTSGGVELCIRVLMLVNTDKGPEELTHVYLKGARDLRK